MKTTKTEPVQTVQKRRPHFRRKENHRCVRRGFSCWASQLSSRPSLRVGVSSKERSSLAHRYWRTSVFAALPHRTSGKDEDLRQRKVEANIFSPLARPFQSGPAARSSSCVNRRSQVAQRGSTSMGGPWVAFEARSLPGSSALATDPRERPPGPAFDDKQPRALQFRVLLALSDTLLLGT